MSSFPFALLEVHLIDELNQCSDRNAGCSVAMDILELGDGDSDGDGLSPVVQPKQVTLKQLHAYLKGDW